MLTSYVVGPTNARSSFHKTERRRISATSIIWRERPFAAGSPSRSARRAYSLLEQIAKLELEATVSVKLTQLGLDFSEADCRANIECLVTRAKSIAPLDEVDMESSIYVDRTLQLVSNLHAQYGSVRAVLQAYLYRTESDVHNLCLPRSFADARRVNLDPAVGQSALLQVLLMVIFGPPEHFRWNDLGHNRAYETALSLAQLLFGRQRFALPALACSRRWPDRYCVPTSGPWRLSVVGS